MQETTKPMVLTPRLNTLFLGLALAWTVVLVALAIWSYMQSSAATMATARSAALESYSKDIVYRRWASIHGGVYAPITPETPPNPYLVDIPERDIETPSGRKLTLINPAYMTRQVYALGEKDFGSRGHITSLNPIRPENRPDDWETRTLQRFEKGEKEAASIEQIGHENYFRFMRPLVTETGCLTCHAAQGYKLGDLRGGISVSLPWRPFAETLSAQRRVLILAYGGIWLMGILGIAVGRNRFQDYLIRRRRAEEALTHSHDLMRYIIEHNRSAVAVHDRELRYLYVSQRYLDDYKVKERDVIGKHHYAVFPDLPQKWRDVHQKALAGVISSAEDDVFERADGSVEWTRWECRPWYEMDGSIGGIIVYTEVVTERIRAEEEKRKLTERLQRSEKMEALGQLAGGVAHDLNNVLGILSGYSELLLAEMPEGNRSRGHVEKILQSTEKGAAIIQDLLTLARRGVTASEVIDPNRVVSDFLKTPAFENMQDHHPRVTFRTELAPNLLHIKGSPVHLEKTLANLLLNAAESIPSEGVVTIRSESLYLDKPLRGYDEIKEGDYTVLTVADTGKGIPPENREKIFEPFYTKKAMGRSGTGLGLAIVWGTVKDHNGYIDVQSEVGKGTVFTLYFPATREEPVARPQKEPIEQYMGRGESVLVVDDIGEQRDIAARLLTKLGYEVHAVSSGEEAVEGLKGNKADILVLDMIMDPGIDGLETYRRILEIHPRQKAILVSGFSRTDRVREAQRLGAGAYVRKPYTLERIGTAVRDELNR